MTFGYSSEIKIGCLLPILGETLKLKSLGSAEKSNKSKKNQTLNYEWDL